MAAISHRVGEKISGSCRKSMGSMKNRIEESCGLLADAIEDMGGRKSPFQ